MTIKKYPASKEFFTQLHAGVKHKIFLLLGEEEGEKDKAVKLILDRVFGDSPDRGLNTGRFILSEDKNARDEFTSAADFVMGGSMFSNIRVCVIRNINNVKFDESLKNTFSDMVSGMPDGTIIVMTSTDNQPPAFIEKDYPGAVHIVQFWKYFDRDLINYIQKTLAGKKIDFHEKIVPLIIELAGSDIRRVDEIIDMAEYSGKGMHVSEEMIRELAGDVRDVTVFELTDMLFRKEKRSLTCLKQLLDDGIAELLILNMITRQADMLEKYFRLLDDKLNSEEAMTKIGLGSGKIRREKFGAILKRFTRDNLKRTYPLIARAEYMLKSSGASGGARSPLVDLAFGIVSMK
ncbi:MAG TPA: DNA polymerase III subunit delta [Spirochaetota bacterium]|nr:DNA polymerase III subunit delta [Spirochaetota bacterium]